MECTKKVDNMRWSDVMHLLDQEIEWCLENGNGMVKKKYKHGFLDGIKQSKYLITRVYMKDRLNQDER